MTGKARLPEGIGFRFAMLSHLGRRRSGNEDVCAASAEDGVFVVCDGMGGAASGEVASQLAAGTFLDRVRGSLRAGEDPESLLREAVAAANAEVYARGLAEPRLRGMGTTLVALLAGAADGELWLTHVGDSRCYRLRGGELRQLTQDHSLVQEQIMAGQLTPEQAERSPMRNIITRSVGPAETVRAEVRRLGVESGDLYLLASDGLTRELTDEALATMLAAGAGEALETVCANLVDAGNEAGGRDNITVLLLCF